MRCRAPGEICSKVTIREHYFARISCPAQENTPYYHIFERRCGAEVFQGFARFRYILSYLHRRISTLVVQIAILELPRIIHILFVSVALSLS